MCCSRCAPQGHLKWDSPQRLVSTVRHTAGPPRQSHPQLAGSCRCCIGSAFLYGVLHQSAGCWTLSVHAISAILPQSMQQFGEQHQPEPGLPSAEELRERAALGEMGAAGVAAAPAGSLGHLMLVSTQLIACFAPSTQV